MKIDDIQEKYFGPRYRGANLAEMDFPVHVQTRLSEYMKNPKNMLIFIGSPGIGKTRFLAALVEWMSDRNRFKSIRIFNERNLISRVKEVMEKDWDVIKEVQILMGVEPLHPYGHDLIVYDDLGSSIADFRQEGDRFLEWRGEILFEIVDSRYNSMKPLIITTNLTREDLKKYYSRRICDRLFATENCIIELEEESKRGKGL